MAGSAPSVRLIVGVGEARAGLLQHPPHLVVAGVGLAGSSGGRSGVSRSGKGCGGGGEMKRSRRR